MPSKNGQGEYDNVKVFQFVDQWFLSVFMLRDELFMPVPAFHDMNCKFPEFFIRSSTE